MPTGLSPGGHGTGHRAVSTGDGVQISWEDDADNESGYEIQRSADGGQTWTSIYTTVPDGTGYFDGLAGSGAISYRVRAVREIDANLDSGWSAVVTVTI